MSRRQLLDLGGSDRDLARMVRRRELVRLHPGVFVDHTGEPSRTQREWGGVLAHWPAVLTGAWALPTSVSVPVGDTVHVAIDVRRSVRPVPGVRAHRTSGLAARADWARCPPRMRIEHAALDVAAGMDDVGRAFQVLCETVQTRRTTPARIVAALATRRGLRHGRLLGSLLHDLAAGTCSVLEREYLHRVERPHGLPTALRQARAGSDGAVAYRDVLYAEQSLVVELDGRAFHDTPAARAADATRDLLAAVDSTLQTVRLTHHQVLVDACPTAERVAVLLARRGWTGRVRRCPDCPENSDRTPNLDS